MTIRRVPESGRERSPRIAAVAAISAAFAVTTSGAHTHSTAAARARIQPAALTARQAAFRNEMRELS
jgi:hypothetical protein